MTTQRFAETLDIDETQVIHAALLALAVKALPQYEADDGPLSAPQMPDFVHDVTETASKQKWQGGAAALARGEN